MCLEGLRDRPIFQLISKLLEVSLRVFLIKLLNILVQEILKKLPVNFSKGFSSLISRLYYFRVSMNLPSPQLFLQLIRNLDPSVSAFNFIFQCSECPLNHGCRVSVLSLTHVCIFIQNSRWKWRVLLDCPPLAIDSNVLAHPIFDEHNCLPLLEHLMLQGLLGLNHLPLIGLVKHLELDNLKKVEIFPNCVSRLWGRR